MEENNGSINVDAVIPMAFVENRIRLGTFFGENDVLFFVGSETENRNSDVELAFRQNSNFLYISGVELPGCFFLLDVGTQESTLFLPDIDDKYPVWHGTPKSFEVWKNQWQLSFVKYVKEMPETMESLVNPKEGKKKIIYALEFDKCPIKNLDEENSKKLAKALSDSRSVKNPGEISIMRETSRVSSLGHIELMKKCQPGLREYQLESLFIHYCSWRGCKHQAYPSIVGAGKNGAILHYSENSNTIKDGDLIVIDAGCEYLGYASDITRTFPANGKFTEQQKLIYGIVLKVQKKLISEIKPGVVWREFSRNASRYLTEELIKAGFIIQDQNLSFEEMVNRAEELKLSGLFMPHGLGHLVGLDVHDCTIYPDVLVEGMIVTVEPGVYFNNFIFDKVLREEKKQTENEANEIERKRNIERIKYLNEKMIDNYRNFGGVRIEDDVLVTKDGFETITNLVPKEIDEIEKIMGK